MDKEEIRAAKAEIRKLLDYYGFKKITNEFLSVLNPVFEQAESMEELIWGAFDAGFFASAEGYNGEYPPPEVDDKRYIEMRKRELVSLKEGNK
jgi:hypothetical protein